MTRLQRVFGGAIALGIPIGYMEYKHISWEPDKQGKRRMALKQTGFWGGAAIAALTFHNKAFRQPSFWKALPLFVIPSLFPILGYEINRRLGKRLFPNSQPPESPTPITLPSDMKEPDIFSFSSVPQEQVQPVVQPPAYSVPAKVSPTYSAWGNYSSPSYSNYPVWPVYSVPTYYRWY